MSRMTPKELADTQSELDRSADVLKSLHFPASGCEWSQANDAEEVCMVTPMAEDTLQDATEKALQDVVCR